MEKSPRLILLRSHFPTITIPMQHPTLIAALSHYPAHAPSYSKALRWRMTAIEGGSCPCLLTSKPFPRRFLLFYILQFFARQFQLARTGLEYYWVDASCQYLMISHIRSAQPTTATSRDVGEKYSLPSSVSPSTPITPILPKRY